MQLYTLQASLLTATIEEDTSALGGEAGVVTRTVGKTTVDQQALDATWIEYIHSVCIAQLIAVHEDLTKKTKNSTRSSTKRKSKNAADDEVSLITALIITVNRIVFKAVRMRILTGSTHSIVILFETGERESGGGGARYGEVAVDAGPRPLPMAARVHIPLCR
jgi:hypothetical protein